MKPNSTPFYRPSRRTTPRDMPPLLLCVLISLPVWALFLALCWWLAGVLYP